MCALSKKICRLLGLSLTVICLPVMGQDTEKGDGAGKLPASAEAVLGKLGQFEAQTILEAQVKIEQKRLEVVRYLEKLLGEETRAGNLDGALAIRKEIGMLKAKPSAELAAVKKKAAAPAGGGEDRAKPKGAKETHAVVGRWAFKDKNGADLVREFTAEGKCMQYRGERKEWTLNYEIVNDREVDVVFLGALKFRHRVRGNDTLEVKEPDTVAEREKPQGKAAGEE